MNRETAMTEGRFISFEGIDGSGKTTAIQILGQYLKDKGEQVLLTREPGGTQRAEDIRALLLSNKMEGADGLSEAMMVFAARNEHLQGKIIPALKMNQWVLCDRFTDATFAYQCSAQGLDWNKVEILSDMVHSNRWPDKTFWLKIPVEKVQFRLHSRTATDSNRYDKAGLKFQRKVHKGYQTLAEKYSHRIVTINAEQQPKKIVEDIIKELHI